MNSWAAGATYDCNFLCICVLGDRSAYGLCKEMSTQMKLTHCVNGFVASPSDMPTYGQLGCQGFIVLDKEHNVVSEGTTPFMQVRALAFQHVEALLDAICNNTPIPSICPGEMGEIIGPELTGCRGVCIKVHKEKVDFGFMDGPHQGKMMSFHQSMVRRLSLDEEGGGGGGGSSCGTGTCGVGTCGSGQCGDKGTSCKDVCADGSCGSGSCKPTGCDPSSCEKPECQIDADFLEQSLDIASVKVSSMDSEHAECAKALRVLAEKRSEESLQDVLKCLSDHFLHEEQLFEQFGFGVHVNEKLSAKKSHTDEHHRLLDKVQKQLARGTVPAGFVKDLLKDFHEHTSLYDMQYADFLASKGAS
ncbi:unnamed protein product [Durusdinium trenchii]|uniref:ANK_REP_REGION domain-containing protein n=2 Tax=Durusdinium trenchii TaxID=1381693 RepID=A0ABP0LMD3_9DINO